MKRTIYGAEGVIVTASYGAEYTRHGGQLIRVNKPQLTKKERNKDKKLKCAAQIVS